MGNKERYVLLAIILLLLFSNYKSFKAYQYEKSLASDLIDIADYRFDVMFKLEDSLSRSVKKADVLSARAKDLEVFYENELNKLRKNLSIKNKKISSILSASVRTTDTIIINSIDRVIDSVLVKDTIIPVIEYSDQWADINLSKSMFWWHVDYEVRDTISFAISKKDGFFKKGYTVSAQSSNPHTNIIGLEGISIDEKKKRLYIGPYIGVDYNLKPSAGISIGFGLIRF